MNLTQKQKDLLVGTLLGDGNLQTSNNGQTWRYRALHKTEHFEYIQHKYEILKDFCSNSPRCNQVLDERTNKLTERCYFNTNVQNSFRYYGNLFYKKDNITNRMIKDVPVNIQQILTPRSIAYWYMDDGSLKWLGHSNAMRICTESFTADGVRRLKTALKNLYSIDAQLIIKTNQKKFVGYRLGINEKNSKPFRELIEPYLIPCMRYKVSDGNKGHL